MLVRIYQQHRLLWERSIHDPYIGQLLMLNDRGDLDPVFNSGEPLNTQLAKSSTVWRAFLHQTDGKLVVAGAIDKDKNSHMFDIVVARFDQSGELDADFNDGLGWARTRLSTQSDGATAVTLQNDKIVIGGVSHDSGVVVRYHS
ncbi:delta-60 repeat domain-containing protein [Pseudomonas grandcourensis]|uniref:delta-60 repeat domain-containing protein n=1 Tax=Pseudomonas grandcourensis TaxID=3136736 RepID=UPI0032672E29